MAQDWGGPIGFSVLTADPDRFARVVAANTILHIADPALAERLTWAVHGSGESRVVLEEARWETVFAERVPGAQDQPHRTISGAGHFLQEDAGEQLGRVIADFVAESRPAD